MTEKNKKENPGKNSLSKSDSSRLLSALVLTKTALMEQDLSLRYTAVHNLLLGLKEEDLIGKRDSDFLPKPLAQEITAIKKRVLSTGKSELAENYFIQDGNEVVFFSNYSARKNESGEIDGLIIISHEVSQLRRLEKVRNAMQERIDYMSNFESMAIMAAGIAHEFNNLLSGIFGYIDLAHDKCEDTKTKQYINKALSTIDRARELTEQLVTFAKGGAPKLSAQPILPLIKGVVTDALDGRNTEVDFAIQPDLWPGLFDEAQIARVVEVLVQNAYQSMMGILEKPKITITASNVIVNENEVEDLHSGKYIKVAIKDHGSGIPDGILKHIYEPYFSTKGAGRGLGLATVYSILQHHKGTITVKTKVNRGSTFTFYIPFGEMTRSKKKAGRKPVAGNTRRILFMDDDEFIRDAFTDVLVSMGYSVSSAQDGNEVIEILKNSLQEERFAAIILDLHVDGGPGAKEIISTIRDLDAVVPVFLASGSADDPAMADYEKLGFNEKIEKPFKRKELASLLRNYMNS
jgi:signal transduction histidine kinase/ActR/RegA family two-component response regulator